MTPLRRITALLRPVAPPAAPPVEVPEQSESSKALCEESYPCKVDVRVPRGGLGRRLGEMMVWCDEHSPRAWGTYEHRVAGRSYLRFYFADEASATDFIEAWRPLRPRFSRR
ncbi:MAG: hypothetical protein IRY94_14345 [Rhodospirillaceae bacterium]|nr:hypothetical protein [Rhodospirillaceae bacterium]